MTERENKWKQRVWYRLDYIKKKKKQSISSNSGGAYDNYSIIISPQNYLEKVCNFITWKLMDSIVGMSIPPVLSYHNLILLYLLDFQSSKLNSTTRASMSSEDFI